VAWNPPFRKFAHVISEKTLQCHLDEYLYKSLTYGELLTLLSTAGTLDESTKLTTEELAHLNPTAKSE
jgi:hypothetical protein